jgi:hypothetical protein
MSFAEEQTRKYKEHKLYEEPEKKTALFDPYR